MPITHARIDGMQHAPPIPQPGLMTFVLQSMQALPFAPQKAAASPGTHVCPSQQPPLQGV